MSNYPSFIIFRGKRLVLLGTKSFTPAQIMDGAIRIDYGYPAEKYIEAEIVLMRFDFGKGIDWTDWDVSFDADYVQKPAQEMTIDALEKALVRMFPEQMELRPTDKLRHELPKRPNTPAKPKPRLQPTPPEAKGKRVKMDLSGFIRPFQSGMTKGNKKK